jgi:hypothetical protein
VVPLKVNVNLRAGTVEDLVGRRKDNPLRLPNPPIPVQQSIALSRSHTHFFHNYSTIAPSIVPVPVATIVLSRCLHTVMLPHLKNAAARLRWTNDAPGPAVQRLHMAMVKNLR